MRVKYDALNRFEVPDFYICNPGSTCTNGVLTNVIGCFTNTSDEELVLHFNAQSELNMRAYRIDREDSSENAYALRLYDALQIRRLIFIDGLGYFVITKAEDGYADGLSYKDISASSCEKEIENKMLTYIEDGTYQFTPLLERIVATLPLWTIGHIDSAVAEKHRTFEDVNTEQNTLAFMLDDMQEAYECIFLFDILDRRINVYDQNTYVVRTDIHMTKEDVIKSLKISEAADNLYTSIRVTGDENLNIAPVNPLGTNVIYDFSYYLDWMSEGLKEKVVAWDALVAQKQPEYRDLNSSLYSKMTERDDAQAEIEKLDIQISMYRRCRENIVAQGNTYCVDSYNTVIEENGGKTITISDEVTDTIAVIDGLIAEASQKRNESEELLTSITMEMDTVSRSASAIRDSVSFSTYFTELEYAELFNYIYEGTYQDEYITVTDSMTYAEKFGQMSKLYERATSELRKVSRHSQEFSIDVENFIFTKEFEPWSEELETGCLINVELNDDDIAELFLSRITVNYDDKSLQMTFGNRFNKFDPKSLYNNALGKINKSANTLEILKDVVYPIKDGELDEMKSAIGASRILTKNAVLASENQDVTIDDMGYTGRKLLKSGEFDPRQVKLISNAMVFTADGWNTAEIAIGELTLSDGETMYGVNAKALIGDIIIGRSLRILDSNGDDLLNVVDGKISASVSDKISQSGGDKDSFGWSLTTDGFRLTSKGKQVFYASADGATISGNITADAGKIGGWNIDGTKLFSGGENGLKTACVQAPDSSDAWVYAAGGNSHDDYSDCPFRVRADGSLYASNITVTGGIIGNCKINSSGELRIPAAYIDGTLVVESDGAAIFSAGDGAVQMGGWRANNRALYSGNSFEDATCFLCASPSSSDTMDIGGSGEISGWMIKAGNDFGVTNSGALYASNASISGDIHATSGEISRFQIDDTGITGIAYRRDDTSKKRINVGFCPGNSGTGSYYSDPDTNSTVSLFIGTTTINPPETGGNGTVRANFMVDWEGNLKVMNAKITAATVDTIRDVSSISVLGEDGNNGWDLISEVKSLREAVNSLLSA